MDVMTWSKRLLAFPLILQLSGLNSLAAQMAWGAEPATTQSSTQPTSQPSARPVGDYAYKVRDAYHKISGYMQRLRAKTEQKRVFTLPELRAEQAKLQSFLTEMEKLRKDEATAQLAKSGNPKPTEAQIAQAAQKLPDPQIFEASIRRALEARAIYDELEGHLLSESVQRIGKSVTGFYTPDEAKASNLLLDLKDAFARAQFPGYFKGQNQVAGQAPPPPPTWTDFNSLERRVLDVKARIQATLDNHEIYQNGDPSTRRLKGEADALIHWNLEYYQELEKSLVALRVAMPESARPLDQRIDLPDWLGRVDLDRLPIQVVEDLSPSQNVKTIKETAFHQQLQESVSEFTIPWDSGMSFLTMKISRVLVEGMVVGSVLGRPVSVGDFLFIVQFLVTRQLLQNWTEVQKLLGDQSMVLPPVDSANRRLREALKTDAHIYQESDVAIYEASAREKMAAVLKSAYDTLPLFGDAPFQDHFLALLMQMGVDPKNRAGMEQTLRGSFAEGERGAVALVMQNLQSDKFSFATMPDAVFDRVMRGLLMRSRAAFAAGAFNSLANKGLSPKPEQRAEMQRLIDARSAEYTKAIPASLIEQLRAAAQQLTADQAQRAQRENFERNIVEAAHRFKNEMEGKASSEDIDVGLLRRLCDAKDYNRTGGAMRLLSRFTEDTLHTPLTAKPFSSTVIAALSEVEKSEEGKTRSYPEARATYFKILERWAGEARVGWKEDKPILNEDLVEAYLSSDEFAQKSDPGVVDPEHRGLDSWMRTHAQDNLKKDLKDWVAVGQCFHFDTSMPSSLNASGILSSDDLKTYEKMHADQVRGRYPILSQKVHFNNEERTLQDVLANQALPSGPAPYIREALQQVVRNIERDVQEVAVNADPEILAQLAQSSIMTQQLVHGFQTLSGLQDEFMARLREPTLLDQIMATVNKPLKFVTWPVLLGFFARAFTYVGDRYVPGVSKVARPFIYGSSLLVQGISTFFTLSIVADMAYTGHEYFQKKAQHLAMQQLYYTRAIGSNIITPDEQALAELQFDQVQWQLGIAVALNAGIFVQMMNLRGRAAGLNAQQMDNYQRWAQDWEAIKTLEIDPAKLVDKSTGAWKTEVIAEAADARVRDGKLTLTEAATRRQHLYETMMQEKTWNTERVLRDWDPAVYDASGKPTFTGNRGNGFSIKKWTELSSYEKELLRMHFRMEEQEQFRRWSLGVQ